MRCACIDIGSNTTRLLVADHAGGVLEPVVQRRVFTRLGRAFAPNEPMPDAVLAELADVVAAHAAEARVHGAEALRVVATAAVRRAANRGEVQAELSRAAGVSAELLSAEDEARLAFAGATCALAPDATEPVGVVDVGGGSTELTVGTCADGVRWSTSLPLGSGDLAAAHLRADPPTGAQLDAVRAQVEAATAALAVPPVTRGLAVGGSATSLARVVGPRLERAGLARALALLTAAPAAAVAAQRELDPERVRLLPAGLLVLDAAVRVFGPLTVAPGGLREGVLLEQAGRGGR